MANLFMLPEEQALKLLLARAEGIFSIPELLIFLPVYFCMVTITAGLTLAAGLFVPMMLLGATYGRILGQLLQKLFSGQISITLLAEVG